MYTGNPYKCTLASSEDLDICQKLWHFIKVTKKGKDQELVQSSTTPDPGYQWENDKLTIRHHNLEQRGQPFPSR